MCRPAGQADLIEAGELGCRACHILTGSHHHLDAGNRGARDVKCGAQRIGASPADDHGWRCEAKGVDVVVAAPPVENRRRAPGFCECVIASAAVEFVCRAPVEDIIARATGQSYKACPAFQRIIAGSSGDPVYRILDPHIGGTPVDGTT